MSTPKKSFQIQSFRQQLSMDVTAAQGLWASLNSAIDQIYNQNASQLSFEELYRNAYNMVLHKHGDILYEGVGTAIQGHLLKSVETLTSTPNDQLLLVLVQMWTSHTTAFKMIKDILMYMDKTYVLPRKKPTLYMLALGLFRETIVFHPNIRDRLKNVLLDNILQERQGFVVDRNLLKTTLSMLLEVGEEGGVGAYETEFEIHFLDETKMFYSSESLDFLANNTCPDYLRKAECRLQEEATRAVNYLSGKATEGRLMRVVEEELIAAHAKTLVDMEGSGLSAMLRDDKHDDLRRMYTLLNRAPPALDLLREGMARFITQCGQSIVDGQEAVRDPVQFVRSVLELKSKMDAVVKESFRSEKRCQKRLKEAFEEFVNKDNRVASYLASYADELLKSGLQGASEEEVDARLEQVMVVFRYLTDKDVFENYHKVLLSKRLLAGKSGSDETERLMVAKLKAECGYQFTSKLEGMFVDMGTSRIAMEEFRRTAAFAHAPLELDVHMLTTGYWPLQALPPCSLPPVVAGCCDTFTAFYLDKHSGRKISWIMQLGSADLKASFPSGRKELSVSTYQMCILLLFNEHSSLTLDAIRGATDISEMELRRHLLSLCTPKLKILRKSSKGKGIESDDVFSFNEEFASKFRRIKVPLISPKEVMATASGEGAAGVEGGEAMGSSGLPLSVEEDRRHLVEAAVVRTMKSRKQLSHNELIAEVTHQLSYRFVATPPFIKKRIESLIEREYLARDKDDARIYNYLA